MGTLAGALLVCASAQAQSTADIGDRIEATFDLILNNTAELAIPLTRRALARRFDDDESTGVEPLPYHATESQSAPSSPEPSEDVAAAVIEQGSAEDETDLARVPRPRPIVVSEATASPDPIGRPLDLVAGAAAPEEEKAAPVSAASATEVASAEQSDPVVAAAGQSDLLISATSEEPNALIVPTEAEATTGSELVAADACLSVDDVTDADGDFKRNAEVLSGASFCITQEEFKERRRSWVIQTVKSRKPGPLWALMHDDEDTSFDTAVQALRSYGGTLVAIESGGKRNVSGVDPNRNLSGEGIGCSKLGKDAAPRFAKFMRDLIDAAPSVVALHSNSPDRIPSGGLGHVSMDLVPKSMRVAAAPDPDGPLAGNHDLVLIAAKDLDDPTAAIRMETLSGEGINVVLERVKNGDCSLSNFAVLLDHPNYFNVTVDHGEGEKQMRIVDVLMSGNAETVASQ